MAGITLADVESKYSRGEPLTMLTAYDAPMAGLVAESGVDMILVGDSAGHNHHGYEDTIPLTTEEALSNTAAVTRGADRPLVVGDLPFNAYGPDVDRSVRTAGRFLKEACADAVKLETAPGGTTTVDIVGECTELGIPVMGHVGLTPQRANEMGGTKIQGRAGPESEFADELVETAGRLADAGVFALVVEGTTEAVARRITEAVDVPTLGIGAGRYTDGQVLVTNDVIGLDPSGYKLAKQYADVGTVIEDATTAFVEDVEAGEFPTREHAYEPMDDE
ncbi:3-methyl-2-oxobutanoate hydroxymethyltransferase [Halomicrococcus gelatinilyticus]|uniref:3-methyl-2-oxobutanoate hydroxymethyltransferase n=1 Tax=Halomicrococcus gelatinilyticus TaxID=1702103 RepID=UPI002E11E548